MSGRRPMAFDWCPRTGRSSSRCHAARGADVARQSHQRTRTAAAAAQPASVPAAAGRPVLGDCDGSKHFMAVAADLLRCCDAACTLNMQQQVYWQCFK